MIVGHAVTSRSAILEDAMEMRLLVGQGLAGSVLSEVDEAGGLGCGAFNPTRLLADLELRLGIPSRTYAPAVRVQALSARMAAVAGDRFYSASYRRDPLGTATALLEWRDELVAAGWGGQPIEGGGARLAALSELESPPEPVLPPGEADRLRMVEEELVGSSWRIYDSIALVDDLARWPARWRTIFAALARAGARVESRPATVAAAAAGCDLGRIQAALAEASRMGTPLTGDGSLLVLRADTATEAALAVAALLGRWGTANTAVVRGGEAAALDSALAAHGLAPIGTSSPSTFRPAAQVLALAIELLFEPKDPHRILDLLTLPVGPLQAITRRALARAMSSAPGIGGRAWQGAKDRVRERILAASWPDGTEPSEDERTRQAARQLALVETWLEAPGHDRVRGAPREALAAAGQRVAEWARGQLAGRPDDPVLLAAHRQTTDFIAALSVEPRERLSLVAARHLLTSVSASLALVTREARAGRVESVDEPGALLVPRDTVIWWHFAADSVPRGPRQPWREDERTRLAEAGVELIRSAAWLAAETRAWRNPVLLARERLLLVMPSTAAGTRLDPHPLWNQLQAASGASGEELSRVTVSARDLLAGQAWCTTAPEVESVPPLPLPSPRVEWLLPGGTVPVEASPSASTLEVLIGCPLRFVLENAAGVRPERIAAIPPPFSLAGTLGHRLVEELHREGAFGGTCDLGRRSGEIFDALLPAEALPLLLDGASFERLQIRRQLVDAAVALGQVLSEHGLRVTGVEVSTVVEWRGRSLGGRLDLLAERDDGSEVVLDLKWGRRTYVALLEQGRAIQLATYSYLRQSVHPSARPVPAAYFSLSRGELLVAPDLARPGRRPIGARTAADTWPIVERTALALAASLASGRIPVTGVAGAPSLGEVLGRGDLVAAPAGSACTYCSHDALCGRRWETRS